MSAETPYDKIAAYYDLEHAGFTDDTELFLQFIAGTGGPVLELGCGTGRILRAIAAAGFQITGLDSSRPMLDLAQEHATMDGLEDLVTLIEGDFERVDLVPSNAFQAVLIAIDSLLHATSIDSQLRVLCAAWTALAPGGLLLLDLLHPTPGRLLAMDGGLALAGSWTLDDGSTLDKIVAQVADPVDQSIHSEIWYETTAPDSTIQRIRTGFEQRWIGQGEIELMLRLTGFHEWHIYGSYALDPLDAQSDRMIVAAEKGDSQQLTDNRPN